ncbi:MAG TPA: hypothetical protein VD905_07950 [Flavobacteriales bacterium]|nr:hypothetical protein [Flavobacteriales bacterium]
MELKSGSEKLKGIYDKTQTTLATVGAQHREDYNLELIGADGRKAYKDGEGVQGLSLKNKSDYEGHYIVLKDQPIVPSSMLYTIMDKYADRCLNFKGGDPTSEAQKLNTVIMYADGTDTVHIMMNTFEENEKTCLKITC